MRASGRRAEAAAEALLRPLQRALSCVTAAVLIREYSPPGQPQRVTTGPEPVALPGNRRIALATLIAYEVTPGERARGAVRTARVTGYAYEIRAPDAAMVLAFHWHPVGRSPVTWPHLHIGASDRAIDLGKAHVPTGFVTLQQVLRFAIEDLGVRPLRDDWREVLAPTPGEPLV